MFKILLVNPACLDERISSEDDRVVPIGLYYIGALLKANDYEVQILNLADRNENPLEVFSRALETFCPDVVGFSIVNPNRLNAIEAAMLAKKKNQKTYIVFGGPCATFLDDHLFLACSGLDFIVKGEAEKSFLQLVQALEKNDRSSFDKIGGLVFRKQGGQIKNHPGEPAADLDALPHPSDYFTFQHLAMSRGCPGKCTFCGSPRFWGKAGVRFHSAQWMVCEIQALYKKGIRHFFISDDTFTMNKDRVITLCKLIIKKGLIITWNAISRVDYIDKEILFYMRKAGCIQISYGVESGSDKIRKVLGKPIDQKKIIQAFQMTVSHGILPRAYFIYGSPGEDDKTISQSLDLLKEIKPLSAIFYILVLFPGTHLYKKALDKGQLSDDVWLQKIEDIPWFQLDETLDFDRVKEFGDRLRNSFFRHVDQFATSIELVDQKELYPFHADFLSRLGMTFSHGEYAGNDKVANKKETARHLYQRALSYHPDFRAFLGLSMLLQKQHQFADAIQFLKKGLYHFPENKELNTCMGICLMNTGQFIKALDFFE
ncbi:MAG: radical SAM protein, partial [Desulfobacteraceae bacterium]|nr:radical SAM protein [Desulfobacteraceae bacterium]